jgi:hypothetical protein
MAMRLDGPGSLPLADARADARPFHSSVGEGDVVVPLAKRDSLREIFPLQTHWLPATGTLPMNDFRAD